MTVWILAAFLAAEKPATKPKVELKANPQFAMLSVGPSASATIRFRLSVKDGGDEDYYCPRLEWEWEDLTTSSEESDCPPFADAQPQDHERSWTKSHQFREPGEHTIRVRLYKGERVIRALDTKVEISGEAVPGRYRERE
jgi:hypothetical protein